MKKNNCESTRPPGSARWKTPASQNRFRGLLLFVAALFGAGIMAHAANILVNPGFESAPIFSSWSAQTTETWSMNAAVGNGDLFRSGANGLWTQGLYRNGGAPAYYNMAAFQKIACAPGATFTADAWYSAFTHHPGHLGGDDGNGYSLPGTYNGEVEDCWVEVQFLDAGNVILADYKSVILSPISAVIPGSAGVSTFNVTDPTLATVTNNVTGDIHLDWIHCVVTNQFDLSTIGPNTDPAKESVTNTLSNGIMTAPPGTAFVKYILGLAQQEYQSGANYWDDCTLVQLGGPSPSVISALTPNGSKFFYTNTSLTFTVTSASSGGYPLPTNPTNQIHVLVNGADQQAKLQFAGTDTAWNVTLPNLASNALFSVVITVNNSASLVTTATANFDTFTPAIVVPVETFDYNGGQFLTNPIPTSVPDPNSYFGLAGVQGIDMSTYNGTGALPGGASTLIPNYPNRTDAAEGFEHNSDTQLPLYIAANNPAVYNVDFSYNNPGNWYNYTRNPWPSGNYEVFARIAGGQGAGSECLNLVTSGVGTTTQTTNRLGEFDIPNPNLYNGPQGSDWSHYYWVPLTDASGNLVPVNVPAGQQTLQLLSSPIAGENVISFLFVPFPGAGLPPSISNIIPANGTPFADAPSGLTFTAAGASGSTVNSSGIHLNLNGADVTSGLIFSGSGPINASYLHLQTNTIYTAVIAVTNTAGAGTTRTVVFDTMSTANFYVKFIDFDFNGGSYDTAGNGLVPNAYIGDQFPGDTGAILGVDYNHSSATGTFPYRGPTGLAQEVTADLPLPGFSMGSDYDAGWLDSGNWANYTRNYPAGKYYVYGRLAGYSGTLTFAKVTAGLGTTNQTLQTLGTCNTSAINQGWQTWNWCLLQNNGLPSVVTLNGVETVRMNSGGNVNANYFMLVPVQGISVAAVKTGGSVGISFPTTLGLGYSVWQSTTLGGAWTLVQSVGGDGTVKTVNIPTTGSQGFLKVTSP